MKSRLKILLAVPAVVYLLSYLYLAWYHGDPFLFDRVVHEGGSLTLLGSMFYFSHFLGHIPVHTVLALVFTGCLLGLGGAQTPARQPAGRYLIPLLLLVAGSLLLGLIVFGREDTLSYLLLQKQGVAIYAPGGSWNLHLVSTVSLFLGIPVFLLVAHRWFRVGMAPGKAGRGYLVLGLSLFGLVTWLANREDPGALVALWTDPRYLAHSVRELMTFPLTYFPVALYFLWKDPARPETGPGAAGPVRLVVVLGVLLAGFLAYQCWLPLSAGIAELAQKPAFAEGGRLSVPYLLASHYFEHLLDSVYFTLLCLFLYTFARRPVVSRGILLRLGFSRSGDRRGPGEFLAPGLPRGRRSGR